MRYKSSAILCIPVRKFHHEGTKHTKIPTDNTLLRVLRAFVVNAFIISRGTAFNGIHVAEPPPEAAWIDRIWATHSRNSIQCRVSAQTPSKATFDGSIRCANSRSNVARNSHDAYHPWLHHPRSRRPPPAGAISRSGQDLIDLKFATGEESFHDRHE